MTERSGKVKTRKKLAAILCVGIVTAISLFIECDVYFPDNIRVYQGKETHIPKGISYTMETSGTASAYGDYDATVKLFGLIPVKEVSVTVSPVFVPDNCSLSPDNAPPSVNPASCLL